MILTAWQITKLQRACNRSSRYVSRMKNYRSTSSIDLSTLDIVERALSVLPEHYSVKDVRGLIAGLRAENDPDSLFAFARGHDFNSPQARAEVSIAATIARATQIIERDGLEPLLPPTPPKAETPAPSPEPMVTATAADIIRAAAIARGEVTPLPVDPVARSIIRAAAKRRGESEKDRPL